jgi:hypothetical protein
MKLFRSREMPDHSIGEDKLGGLVHWPKQRAGWAQRTPYTGGKRPLEEVDPALARGTGWPGGGRGPAPRAASGTASKSLTIRVTDAERTAWEGAAQEHERTLSDWIRDICNAAAPPADVRSRSKSKL